MSRQCAEEMARGARDLFAADVSVATTGVGGPGEEEGHPAGTVFVAIAAEDQVDSRSLELEGSATRIIYGAVEAGLEMLLSVIPD